MPARYKKRDPQDPIPFWSGTITFGLVSVPVDMYSATRSGRASLRMLTPDGTPLKRKYFCSADGKALESKEIVRGFEKPDGNFVVITDEELESLAPRKSRDIDLRRFVDRDQIPVRLLQRSYVLTPAGDSTKAYHLLAQTMERTRLAGIATFVMRGKEYLTAIVAEDGLLRASTLHFADEIRSPEDIGLPEIQQPALRTLKDTKTALKSLKAKSLDEDLLRDESSIALLELAEQKQAKKRDVVKSNVRPDEEEPESGDIIDIMAVLRRRMAEGESSSEKPTSKGRSETLDFDTATKDELYAKAQELDLPGRSGMSKNQLIEALRAAS